MGEETTERAEVKFCSIRDALNAAKPGAVFEARTRMVVVGRNSQYAHLPLPPESNGQSWRHEVDATESHGYFVKVDDLTIPPTEADPC